MVKHIVMFKLRGTEEERRLVASRFVEALMALPEKIECLMGMEAAVNENPTERWDVVLTATLPDMESVATYANHPDHLAAASIVASFKEDRGCVDYRVNNNC